MLHNPGLFWRWVHGGTSKPQWSIQEKNVKNPSTIVIHYVCLSCLSEAVVGVLELFIVDDNRVE